MSSSSCTTDVIATPSGEIEAALQRGDGARALKLCRAALSVDPGDAVGVQLLGIAFVNLGRGDEALAAFRRRTAVDPLSADGLFNLVTLLAGLGLVGEAGRPLRRALALGPGDGRGWELYRQLRGNSKSEPTEIVVLGRLGALTGNLDHEALKAERQIDAGQGAVALWSLRRLLLGHPERIPLARLLLRAVGEIVRKPGRIFVQLPSSYFGRGAARLATGKLEAAASAFHASLVHDPACVGSRAAYAATIHFLTESPPSRVDVEGVGAVGIEKNGRLTRLTPVERRERGRFLFAYNAGGVLLPETDERFRKHSNQWESRAIARALLRRGFSVDLLGLHDPCPRPDVYDGVFCLHNALDRFGRGLRADCHKIMLLAGSSPDFQNAQELSRIEELYRRSGFISSPTRQIADAEGELRSLRMADECWLMGNQVTLSTYEPAIRPKIRLLRPSGAEIRAEIGVGSKQATRRWLWFSGHGAVLKGLDRVVEVFLRRREWQLDIVGPAADEDWFEAAYGESMRRSANFTIHGTLSPVSKRFSEVVAGCVGFVAPAASEGMSTAAITCLQAGLYPVLSKRCGIDLPAGCGITLEDSSLEEIEAAIQAVHELPEAEVAGQQEAVMQDARQRFSRTAFAEALNEMMTRSLGTDGSA